MIIFLQAFRLTKILVLGADTNNSDKEFHTSITLRLKNRLLRNLLIKLKDTFFDTDVGPRPNLARMCG